MVSSGYIHVLFSLPSIYSNYSAQVVAVFPKLNRSYHYLDRVVALLVLRKQSRRDSSQTVLHTCRTRLFSKENESVIETEHRHNSENKLRNCVNDAYLLTTPFSCDVEIDLQPNSVLLLT